MTTTRCRYWINSDTSELPGFMEFRCILFGDTSESDIFDASRCIIALVSVGDTSGLRFQFPSRCMETQIYLHNTSGWANTGYFRCIAKNRQNKIHRNSKFSSNPDVSQLISRDDTSIPSQHTPAQVNLTLISRDDTSIPSQHTPARINLTLISREYTHIPFAAYSRASQPHFNFPRIYFHPLAAYSRANQPHIIQRELYIMYSPRCRTPNKTITQNIISL